MSQSRSPSSSGGGLDVTTLLITAVASATAAYTCSKLWAPGTLASAAFTPVAIALIKEGLARPAQVVTQAVPVRGVVRSAPPPRPPESPVQGPPEPAPPPPPPEGLAQGSEISLHRSGTGVRRWRLAIVTGLLGFVVAALAFTVPELLAGNAADGGRGTTFFGGDTRTQPAEQTPTTTVPGRTVTIAPPTTVTVPAPAQPAPADPVVTVPPAATTPAPAPSLTTTEPPAAGP